MRGNLRIGLSTSQSPTTDLVIQLALILHRKDHAPQHHRQIHNLLMEVIVCDRNMAEQDVGKELRRLVLFKGKGGWQVVLDTSEIEREY